MDRTFINAPEAERVVIVVESENNKVVEMKSAAILVTYRLVADNAVTFIVLALSWTTLI